MAEPVPAWLAEALPQAGPEHGRLTVARLGGPDLVGRSGFTLRSAAFSDGDALDPSFTAGEEDAVAPPLEWTAPPAGAMELVLVVEDPHAPGAEPFCHWLVWGLAAQKGQLLEGEVPPRVGKNAFGNSEWLLPDPPQGSDPHDYVFQLFALDLPLVQMPGATREELVAAMKDHVVGVALLTGTFARSDEDFEDWDEGDEG
ncbi:hypothetical protein AEB_P3473 [Altererythrobacter sp. B11]|uniref:YbhB/YbcL family Raf kinase inhibitor-like protein n=1 Tax=Altererythrobacter sp. B11 TaxID=2060312 RepID=UPI000DC73BE7|nr:YbhB/YbcL family Raf kinase inhibitor-like protein [Altererythrobacter sp. B11]BBC74341.1 hypothetical protein AEB_P3473 [Altererythrobacter sp. B11]